MDYKELETRAAEQEEARAEAFKKGLASEREREGRATAQVQNLLARIGERLETENKAAMDAQIEAEEKRAAADIREKYQKECGAAEWNDRSTAPLKNMLKKLV